MKQIVTETESDTSVMHDLGSDGDNCDTDSSENSCTDDNTDSDCDETSLAHPRGQVTLRSGRIAGRFMLH